MTQPLNNLSIAIGSDHAGYELKSEVITYLSHKGLMCRDFGTYDTSSMDYPDVAHPLSSAVSTGAFSIGILICGSANGVAITANKHAGIRAAICWRVDIAELARKHNDANILCLPARFIDKDTALQIVDAFLSTAFEGGRHLNRVQKINC